MADRNGYFQLIIKSDGTYLHIYPATGSGEKLAPGEVSEYLSSKGIACSPTELSGAIKSERETEIRLNSDAVLPEQETMRCQIVDGGMKAVVRFYPPSEGAATMDKEDIIKELRFRKIVYGIKEDEIERFLSNREYCRDYTFAEGTPVEEGVDSVVEYFFDTDLNRKPAQLEDGSVDFFHLNTFCRCKEGQVLARLTPEKPGKPGKNVLGEVIRPKDIKRQTLQYGQNITISEDKTTLTANVNGHVELVDDKVFVSAVLPLTNVDVSTGNVDYDGNVQIQGNVVTGFSVHASGDVEVQGVVEGAEIIAGGSVTIGRGVNGMARGQIKAGKNVIARYIENANVHADGFIQSGSILHSNVSAKTEIIVQGKRGFIAGGVVRAGSVVEARILGSNMGVDTLVEVGTDPSLKERFGFLQKRLAETKKSIAAIEPVIMAVGQRIGRGEKLQPEQVKRMKLLSQTLLAQKEQIRKDTIELTELTILFEKETQAMIRVTGEAYPGTRIVVADANLALKTVYHYCRFVKQGADVVMVAME